ncbi:5-hydroxytryptamine receptor 3A-like [Pelobates cultripes]|uniref:5-hydroxytryptamine receptor 3A-like n=1 Tax=Pelobates cultripes TaxID=61616 RepID=A0AAD1TDB3_PELCU|nr:5-hydroxytryptamine receptor 3A-like [Pelobates cultripes]
MNSHNGIQKVTVVLRTFLFLTPNSGNQTSTFLNCKDIIIAPSRNSSCVTERSLEVFASKGEWILKYIDVKNDTNPQKLIYKISMDRIPLKYIINIIIPAFLMVCMDIVSMFIHPNGDRLGFKITVVFGFSVILLILNNILPNSDSPSALGIFCCAFMAIMIFSIAGYVLTSYMVDLSFIQSKVPRWIKICFLKKLAPVIGVKLKVAKKDMERVLAVENDYYDNNTKRKLQLYKKRKNFHRKVILDAKILRKMLSEIVKIQEKWNMSISKDNMESEWYTAAELVRNQNFDSAFCIFIKMFLFLSLLLTFSFLGVGQCQQNCSFNDLEKDIRNNYSIKLRPAKNAANPTDLNIDIRLYAIVNLEMSMQALTTYLWLNMYWKNDYLSWNSSKYCGITKLHIPYTDFWKPDLYIYEMIDGNSKPLVLPYFKLEYDGKVTEARPLRIVSTCKLDIFKFPFDTQACNLTFGSYVYVDAEIVMGEIYNSSTVTKRSMNILASKGEWKLLNIIVFNRTKHFNSGATFSEVRFQVSIQRVPIKYVNNLVVPAFLLVIADVFSMLVRSYEDRLSFKITVVLGFSVLLVILNNILPNSTSPPILGIFCCVCMGMMSFSTVGSVFTAYIVELSSKDCNVPKWLICLLKYLAPVVRVKPTIKNKVETVISTDKDCYNSKKRELNLQPFHKRKNCSSPEEKVLRKILAEIVNIQNEWKMSNTKEDKWSEWDIAAAVIDRLIFIIYAFIVIILFIVVIIAWST